MGKETRWNLVLSTRAACRLARSPVHRLPRPSGAGPAPEGSLLSTVRGGPYGVVKLVDAPHRRHRGRPYGSLCERVTFHTSPHCVHLQ